MICWQNLFVNQSFSLVRTFNLKLHQPNQYEDARVQKRPINKPEIQHSEGKSPKNNHLIFVSENNLKVIFIFLSLLNFKKTWFLL